MNTASTPPATVRRPRVLIVGAGFGGLAAAQALARSAVDITVVDRRNFHLFQPLLYQVATAGLNPSDVAWPIRNILRSQQNARVVLGEVSGIDLPTQTVQLTDGHRLVYDWLVLATGATHTYFGRDDWAAVAPGLKRIDDATLIRRRILLAFERAENETDPVERQRLMTFAIVGAGPTGVEMAGAIAELAKRTLSMDFRSIDPRDARIVLIEGGERVLQAFPPALSAFAERALKKMGVEFHAGARVIGCDEQGLTIVTGGSEAKLPAGVVLWAAGVAASPAAKWLGMPADRAGRAQVQADLSVAGQPNVFVIGDTAAMSCNGQPVPGIAPAAKQGGSYVAQVIRASIGGQPKPPPFHYRHAGSLATIGRHSAVIDFGFIKLTGWIAWWLWGIAHIYFLIGNRNRLVVAAQWFYNYLTWGRGARLIVGSDAPAKIPHAGI